eukprot:6167203-Amphidinium_carterae.1
MGVVSFQRGLTCGMTTRNALPLIPSYDMTTWDGLAFIPKLWNDNLGWAATVEWQLGMGCH